MIEERLSDEECVDAVREALNSIAVTRMTVCDAQGFARQRGQPHCPGAVIERKEPHVAPLGFERSHPPPQLRTPVIQQTAAAWRATGGRGLPILF